MRREKLIDRLKNVDKHWEQVDGQKESKEVVRERSELTNEIKKIARDTS
jgi:hypothetical protein